MTLAVIGSVVAVGMLIGHNAKVVDDYLPAIGSSVPNPAGR